MLDAYQEFQLSESARAQVGWRDQDQDGVYDVVDTLSDSFTGIDPTPVCPTLHLAGINIDNIPALPDGISNPSGAQWGVHVWDPEAGGGAGRVYGRVDLHARQHQPAQFCLGTHQRRRLAPGRAVGWCVG